MKETIPKLNGSYLLSLSLLVLLGYFIFLMALITWQYIPVSDDAAFLSIKEDEVSLPYYLPVFYIHVYTSIFIIFFGALQFISLIRNKYLLVHRWIGKFYIILILGFSAPSGFIMGLHGNGGFISKLSFCILASLWFYYTFKAYQKIKIKDVFSHVNYMILSYSLTLSAVSLRLFKWMIANTIELPPLTTYKIVVWLGWLVNLGIAYWIINYRKIKI